MLTLQEYDKIAQKLIKVHSPVMIDDTEMLEAVTSAIMMADWQYDPTDHTGEGRKTLEGYRKQRAKWAICETFKKKKRRAKNPIASIDELTESTYIEIPSYEKYISFDYDYLNAAEQTILDLWFNKNLTYREIGRKLRCTKQNVCHKVQSGLRKLRKNLKTPSVL